MIPSCPQVEELWQSHQSWRWGRRSNYTYILMVHMSQQLDFSKSAFGINPVIKCIPNLLDCHLFTSLRIERRASHTKQPDHYMNFNVSSRSFITRIKFSGQNGINISFIRIEKSPFWQWRRNSQVNTPSGSHRKNQTREDRKQTKNEKHTPVWTKVPVSHLFRDHQQ
jgi:hypothetical protein